MKLRGQLPRQNYEPVPRALVIFHGAAEIYWPRCRTRHVPEHARLRAIIPRKLKRSIELSLFRFLCHLTARRPVPDERGEREIRLITRRSNVVSFNELRLCFSVNCIFLFLLLFFFFFLFGGSVAKERRLKEHEQQYCQVL